MYCAFMVCFKDVAISESGNATTGWTPCSWATGGIATLPGSVTATGSGPSTRLAFFLFSLGSSSVSSLSGASERGGCVDDVDVGAAMLRASRFVVCCCDAVRFPGYDVTKREQTPRIVTHMGSLTWSFTRVSAGPRWQLQQPR